MKRTSIGNFPLIIALALLWSGLGLCRDFTKDLDIKSSIKPEYGEATAEAVIDGSGEEVWRVLTDYGNLAEFMPTVRKCRVDGRSGNTVRLYYEIGLSVFTVSYTAELRELEENRIQTWRLLEGPFNVNSGTWSMEPEGEGTRVKYHVRISHKVFPDRIILKLLTGRLPEVYEAIQERIYLNRSGFPAPQ